MLAASAIAVLLALAAATPLPAPVQDDPEEPSPAETPAPPAPGETPLPATPLATPPPVIDETPLPPEPEPTALPAPEPPPPPEDAPRLFLDCAACDHSYLREQVGFVTFVRDRADADVHAIVSRRATGPGGIEWTVRFVGRGRFQHLHDELVTHSSPLATEDDRRNDVARTLRLGLARYAARTEAARAIDVSWSAPGGKPPTHDPWDSWVMRLAASGRFQGERSYRTNSVTTTANASRVTELWKLRLASFLFLDEGRYEIEDSEDVRTFRRDSGVSAFLARGAGPHWSAGARLAWSASTYTNRSSHTSFAPTLEYSLFPYSESTRRALVLQYSTAVKHVTYIEETIFGHTEEVLFDESLRLVLDFTQPWGSATTSVSGGHYLHDVSKSHLSSYASLDLRLVKGLSFNLYGSFNVLRDQINLPKAGATPEEILLQKRQLATSYSYYAQVGLSYTFGSIYAPVVNTRLEPGS